MHDALAASYGIECTFCGATAKTQMNLGVRLEVGQVVPADPSEPARGRCPRCKRYSMKVVSAPPPPPPPKPKGFRRVPEK
jgi:hypothetical protein